VSTSNNTAPLRVALVGAGGLGRGWSLKIANEPSTELVAFVDPMIGTDKESPWLAAEHASVPKFTSLKAAEVAGAEALVVTAFSTAHAVIIKEGLELGKHVIVEKPFTTTLADAEMLVKLAKDKGLTLMVSQNYRYFPGSKMLHEAVKDGRYGKVRSVTCQFWCDWAGKPYQHGMQHAMGLEMAVHHFDMCRAIFDVDPVGGYVREWQQADSQYAGGGAIEGLYDMAGPDNQFPFTYTGSLVGKAPRTPWPGVWRIEFDKDTLVIDTVDGRYGIYRAHADGHKWLGRIDGDDMLFELPLIHFAQSIRNGTEPWSSGRDNLGTMKMALGAEVFGKK
jgi:predicted dehydrogenase